MPCTSREMAFVRVSQWKYINEGGSERYAESIYRCPQGPDQTTGKTGCPSSEAVRRTSQGAREKAHLPSLPHGGLSTGILEVVPVFRTCITKGERDDYFSECGNKGERMGDQQTHAQAGVWTLDFSPEEGNSYCRGVSHLSLKNSQVICGGEGKRKDDAMNL